MKTWLSGLIPIAIITFLTVLLGVGWINSTEWLVGFLFAPVLGLALFGFDRLERLKVRDIELQFQVEKLKEKIELIEERYSAGSFVPEEPFVLDDKTAHLEMGLGGRNGLLKAPAVMRYVAGCFSRERQRLAKIFAESKTPETIAAALVDTRFDKQVYQWAPPEVLLEESPRQFVVPFQVINGDGGDDLPVYQRGNDLLIRLRDGNPTIRHYDKQASTYVVDIDSMPNRITEMRLQQWEKRTNDKVQLVLRTNS